jgi:hypothetical protein
MFTGLTARATAYIERAYPIYAFAFAWDCRKRVSMEEGTEMVKFLPRAVHR